MFSTALRSSLRSSKLRIRGAVRAGLRGSYPPDAQPSPQGSPVENLERRVMLSPIHGAVFVATNANNTKDPSQLANEVLMYNRSANGTLTLQGRFDTGGQGSGPSIRFAGDGLGSAHSVELSQSGRFLLVTNAGSDTVSVFRVSRTGLTLTDVEPTPDFPNSVAQRGERVYVLSNDGGDGAISGYRMTNQGELSPLSNSKRSLDANQDPDRPDVLFNPTQVSFTPNGRQLVVSIKDGPAEGLIEDVTPTGEGRVLTWQLDSQGRPSQNFRQTNFSNRGPFGFSFDRNGNLIQSFFVGGPNLTASAGSFRINASGSLAPISRNVPNGQLDTCWIENNGRFAYGANYGSGTISSYRIGSNGSLTLLKAVAGTTNDLPGDDEGKSQGSTPLDIRVSPNGQWLYNVLPGSGKIAGWRINSDGSLTKVGEFGNLPDTVEGDHATEEFAPGGSPAGIAILDYATPFDTPDRPLPARLNTVYVETNDPRTGRNAILAYRRNTGTGQLTELPGSPFYTDGSGFFNEDDRIGPDDSDQEIIISKDRRFLFAVNQGSHTVSVFRVQPDGSLSLVEGSPVDSGGKQPVSLGLANNNTLVVVNKGDQDPGGEGGDERPNYTTFRVASDGKLTHVAGSTVEVDPGSSPSQALISRDGRFVFGDNFLTHPIDELFPGSSALIPPFGSELESFRVTSDRKLVRNAPAQRSPLPGLADQYILNMQIHPTRNIVYAAFVVSNKIGVYTYDNNGRLTFVRAEGTGAGAGVCWLVTNKAGTRLYGTNFATNSIAVFDTSNPLHPVLIQDVPLKGPKGPHPLAPNFPSQFNTVAFQIAISPDDRFIYSLNHEQVPDNDFPEGNQLHTLRIGSDGKLTEVGSSALVLPEEFVPAGAHPQGVIAT